MYEEGKCGDYKIEFETYRTVCPVRIEDFYNETYRKRVDFLEREIIQIKAKYDKEILELKQNIEKLNAILDKDSNLIKVDEAVDKKEMILQIFTKSIRNQLEKAHETNYTELKGEDLAFKFLNKSYKEQEHYNQISAYRQLENRDISEQKFGFNVAIRSDENKTYRVQCIDYYHAEGSSWKKRKLIFSVEEVADSVYYIRSNDELCMELHKSITPFPRGITFYDSFADVLEKIGIKKEEYIGEFGISVKPNTLIQVLTNKYTCALEFCKIKSVDALYKMTILIQRGD